MHISAEVLSGVSVEDAIDQAIRIAKASSAGNAVIKGGRVFTNFRVDPLDTAMVDMTFVYEGYTFVATPESDPWELLCRTING